MNRVLTTRTSYIPWRESATLTILGHVERWPAVRIRMRRIIGSSEPGVAESMGQFGGADSRQHHEAGTHPRVHRVRRPGLPRCERKVEPAFARDARRVGGEVHVWPAVRVRERPHVPAGPLAQALHA